MKVVFELPEGDKEALKTWRSTKRTIKILKKAFPPDVQKKIEKLSAWDDEFDKIIDEKLALKIMDLQTWLMCLSVVCDVREEK